jgi:ribosome-associated toxin RatA of RatAB toxin-antitoxin module
MKSEWIRSQSVCTYSLSAQELYDIVKNIKDFHRFVPYYLKNKIRLTGKNWLLKEMQIKAGGTRYTTQSVIVFYPTRLSFEGLQLEGPYPGMQWHLKVVPITNKKSRIISSHDIPLGTNQNYSLLKINNLKKRLKDIEQSFLTSIYKKIEGGAP